MVDSSITVRFVCHENDYPQDVAQTCFKSLGSRLGLGDSDELRFGDCCLYLTTLVEIWD
jgi:hypothetical protein